eukprot:Em0021g784a
MKRSCSGSAISNCFRLAGVYNFVCVLLFSKFFTNTLLCSLYPTVLSNFSLIVILLWGIAYASVARTYRAVPHLLFVFTAVKMLYFVSWILWYYQHGVSRLSDVFSESPLTATIYALYGPVDAAFGVFFLWVGLRSLEKSSV